jgi:PAS domain S-box-containing protein
LQGITDDLFIYNSYDISERKQADEKLKSSEEKYRLLFESSKDAILILDPEIGYIDCNNTALEMFRISSKEEFLIATPVDLSPKYQPDGLLSANQARKFVDKAMQDGSHSWEWTHKKTNEVEFAATVLATKFKWGNRDLLQSTIRDITERKQSEKELKESEEKYRELAQSSNSIIMKLDRDYNVIFFNKYAQDFFGFSEDEIFGRSAIGTIIPKFESTGRNLEILIEELFDNPEAFADNENENICKNGERVWIAWRNKSTYNGDGKLSSLLCTGYDITKRKRAEAALKESEEKVTKAFHTSPVIMGISDLSTGEYTEVNQIFYDKLGFTPKEVIGVKAANVIHMDSKFRKRIVAKLQKQGSVLNEETIIYNKNGAALTVLLSAEIIELKNKKYIFTSALDISERKNAEEELKRAHAELELRVKERTDELNQSLTILKQTQQELTRSERLAALGNLVAGIAHEISTPLGIGVTEASFLNDKTIEISELFQSEALTRSIFQKYLKATSESSSSILKNLIRSAELINNFKQVAVDQTIFEQRTFFVKEYLNGVILSLRSEFKRTQHKITLDCSDNLSINSHPGAFAQITSNLIMNSLKHGFHSIDQGEIEFRIKADDHRLVFHYRDNGIGMDEKTLRQVFDPFFTTKRNRGGTGLGMHIVYNIVTQKLKGEVKCNSSPGNGVEFIIEVPFE